MVHGALSSEIFLFTQYVYVDLLLIKKFSLVALVRRFQFAMIHSIGQDLCQEFY
jgi:hypothetical protein